MCVPELRRMRERCCHGFCWVGTKRTPSVLRLKFSLTPHMKLLTELVKCFTSQPKKFGQTVLSLTLVMDDPMVGMKGIL